MAVENKAPEAAVNETPAQPDKEDTGLRIGIGTDENTGNIVVAFGKPVPWIAFRPDEALKFGEMIIGKAQERIAAMTEEAKAALEPKHEVEEPVVSTQAPVLNEGATLSEEPVETPVEPKVDDTTDADGQLNPPEVAVPLTEETPVIDTAPSEEPVLTVVPPETETTEVDPDTAPVDKTE